MSEKCFLAILKFPLNFHFLSGNTITQDIFKGQSSHCAAKISGQYTKYPYVTIQFSGKLHIHEYNHDSIYHMPYINDSDIVPIASGERRTAPKSTKFIEPSQKCGF